MKRTISSLIILISLGVFAQNNTEVYLCDIDLAYGGLDVFNFQNISNDAGYDSQPSFSGNDKVFFAGNNNGQTDIALYTISEKVKTWHNSPTDGSEYSPKLIPNGGTKVSAVRLDPDGLQRLYSYEWASKNSSELIEGLQVAYYEFYDSNTIVASVLHGDNLDLVISNLKEKINDTILTNSGRSIHKILNSKSMSYTVLNEEKNQDLYVLDMEPRESFFICQLPIGIQDYTWLSDTQILIGSGSKLFIYDTFLNSKWVEFADLSKYKINEITRLSVSPNGKKLALVAEPN